MTWESSRIRRASLRQRLEDQIFAGDSIFRALTRPGSPTFIGGLIDGGSVRIEDAGRIEEIIVAGNLDDETVREILRRKRATIKDAGLEPGSPSWDDILEITWEEITERARKREVGFKTFKKLLGKAEYDR